MPKYIGGNESAELTEARRLYTQARAAQREAYETKKKADEALLDAAKRYRLALKGEAS